jgi:hypothetical protein
MTDFAAFVREAAAAGMEVRFRGRAEIVAVGRAHWRELERLSLEGDPETQAALSRFLDQRGHVLARAVSRNLVTTAGKNYALSAILPNGSWFIAQKGAGTIAVGDTMASHAGWTELTTYTQATRPALTLSTPSAGSANNSANVAIFTAPTGGLTMNGWLLANSSTKGETASTLYSAADHSSPQAILAGAALRQSLTASVT